MTLKEDCSTTMIFNTARIPIDLELRGACGKCGGGLYDGEYVVCKTVFTESGIELGPPVCGSCMGGD